MLHDMKTMLQYKQKRLKRINPLLYNENERKKNELTERNAEISAAEKIETK